MVSSLRAVTRERTQEVGIRHEVVDMPVPAFLGSRMSPQTRVETPGAESTTDVGVQAGPKMHFQGFPASRVVGLRSVSRSI